MALSSLSAHNRFAMTLRFLIAAGLLAPFVAASPIAGSMCDVGTLAELIAVGHEGCYVGDGLRIFDISAVLPDSLDPATITFGSGDVPPYAEAAAHFFPIGSTLTIRWDALRAVTMARWYQFDAGGDLSFFTLPLTQTGTMTLSATIADAYLGFQIEQYHAPLPGPTDPFTSIGGGTSGVPEPSAFLPIGGLMAIAAFKRGKHAAARK